MPSLLIGGEHVLKDQEAFIMADESINRLVEHGPLRCSGEWIMPGWDRTLNVLCRCYWLCRPCNYPVIWSVKYQRLSEMLSKELEKAHIGHQSDKKDEKNVREKQFPGKWGGRYKRIWIFGAPV